MEHPVIPEPELWYPGQAVWRQSLEAKAGYWSALWLDQKIDGVNPFHRCEFRPSEDLLELS